MLLDKIDEYFNWKNSLILKISFFHWNNFTFSNYHRLRMRRFILVISFIFSIFLRKITFKMCNNNARKIFFHFSSSPTTLLNIYLLKITSLLLRKSSTTPKKKIQNAGFIIMMGSGIEKWRIFFFVESKIGFNQPYHTQQRISSSPSLFK